MKTPGSAQRGFGAIEGVLIVVLVALLGFAAWYVIKAGGKTKDDYGASGSPSSLATQKYTDTAKLYSLSYPVVWKVSYPAYAKDGGDADIAEPDWTKTSRPVTITPAIGQKDNSVLIQTGCEAFSIAKVKARADKFHTQTEATISGYRTIHDELNFKGDAETYLDDTYALEHDGHCIYLTYRVRHHHPMSGTDFDDSKNRPGFEAIVQSIRFL